MWKHAIGTCSFQKFRLVSQIRNMKPFIPILININWVLLSINNFSPSIITLIVVDTGPLTVSPILRSFFQACGTGMTTPVLAHNPPFLQAYPTAGAALKKGQFFRSSYVFWIWLTVDQGPDSQLSHEVVVQICSEKGCIWRHFSSST